MIRRVDVVYVLLISVFLLHSSDLTAQAAERSVSPVTAAIVKEIEKLGTVEGQWAGKSQAGSKQFAKFVELQKHASKEELRYLTVHTSPVVRCYAFWALALDSAEDLLSIILNHLPDTALVVTRFGCTGTIMSSGDFFIRLATGEFFVPEVRQLSNAQRKVLDSILIYRPNQLWAKNIAIARADADERLLNRLRQLVREENHQAALVKLAKYRRPEDLVLILSNRGSGEAEPRGHFYTYRAVQAFPHPALFNLLKEHLPLTLGKTHYSNEWRELFTAIAAYRSEEARQLLAKHYEDIRGDLMEIFILTFLLQRWRSKGTAFMMNCVGGCGRRTGEYHWKHSCISLRRTANGLLSRQRRA